METTSNQLPPLEEAHPQDIKLDLNPVIISQFDSSNVIEEMKANHAQQIPVKHQQDVKSFLSPISAAKKHKFFEPAFKTSGNQLSQGSKRNLKKFTSFHHKEKVSNNAADATSSQGGTTNKKTYLLIAPIEQTATANKEQILKIAKRRISQLSDNMQNIDIEKLRKEIEAEQLKDDVVIEDAVIAIGDDVESFRSQDNSDASLYEGEISNKSKNTKVNKGRRRSHFVEYVRKKSSGFFNAAVLHAHEVDSEDFMVDDETDKRACQAKNSNMQKLFGSGMRPPHIQIDQLIPDPSLYASNVSQKTTVRRQDDYKKLQSTPLPESIRKVVRGRRQSRQKQPSHAAEDIIEESPQYVAGVSLSNQGMPIRQEPGAQINAQNATQTRTGGAGYHRGVSGGHFMKSRTYRRGDMDALNSELDIIQEAKNELDDSKQKISRAQLGLKKEIVQQQGEEPINAKKRWTKVITLLKTVNLLQKQDAKRLEQASDITSEIRRFPQKRFETLQQAYLRNNIAHIDDSFEAMRRQSKFFNALAMGGHESAQLVKHALESNPKRHMYETTNPKHMVNHENSFGLRPLYIACLHGHLELVQILVQAGANPHLTSFTNIDTKEEETVLQLCARWSHDMIMQFLLGEFKWSNKELQIAMKDAEDKSQTYKLLAAQFKKQRGGCYGFLCR
ncbi:hypothetical protein FGO68_gene7715 [Halteria grandinella]|uniref:Ankyrin repeat domain-containing protein n=1 Tax=Halteria grandinella TaxID=5974 RepID=A0A8J8NZZ8_HALGN|nr:hypothetical protein FGO68_gene7715 [Halteria grandinella]